MKICHFRKTCSEDAPGPPARPRPSWPGQLLAGRCLHTVPVCRLRPRQSPAPAPRRRPVLLALSSGSLSSGSPSPHSIRIIPPSFSRFIFLLASDPSSLLSSIVPATSLSLRHLSNLSGLAGTLPGGRPSPILQLPRAIVPPAFLPPEPKCLRQPSPLAALASSPPTTFIILFTHFLKT